MTEAEHRAIKDAEYATALPGEWCHPCDDWICNCQCDEFDPDPDDWTDEEPWDGTGDMPDTYEPDEEAP